MTLVTVFLGRKGNQHLFIMGNLLFFMGVIQATVDKTFTFELGVLTTLWIIADFCILTQLIYVENLFPKRP